MTVAWATAWQVDFAAIRDLLIAPDAEELNRPAPVLTDDFAPAEFLEAQKSGD